MHTTDSSPLRAAREWRGVSIEAAARAGALTVEQAEALEAGNVAAFATGEEMLGAAVVYGAALGIGRDEALALLRRGMHGETVTPEVSGAYGSVIVDEPQVTAAEPVAAATAPGVAQAEDAPAAPAPMRSLGITHATTSARVGVGMVDDDPVFADVAATNLEAAGVWSHELDAEETGEIPLAPILDGIDHEVDWDTPDGFGEPADELFAGASTETAATVYAARQADPTFAAAIDTGVSELESWAAEQHGGSVAIAGGTQASRVGHFVRTRGARTLGPERAHAWATSIDRGMMNAGDGVANAREWLERSKYGALLVGVVVGVLLMATMYGVLQMVGSSDEPFPEAKQSQTAETATAEKPAAAAKAKTKQAPIKPRTKLTIDVLNAGAVKGKAATEATKLDNKGYKVRDVGNSSTLYATPIILYAPDHRREAVRMGKDTGITTLDKLESLRGGGVNMIVVVK